MGMVIEVRNEVRLKHSEKHFEKYFFVCVCDVYMICMMYAYGMYI